MKKNSSIMPPRFSEQVFASPLALRYIEVPLDMDLDIGKFNPHNGRLVGNLGMKRMGLKY